MRNISTAPAAEHDARGVIRATADLIGLVEPELLRLWRETGMTLSQRRVLRRLREGPRSAGSVAESLNLSAPALTRHLTRLEARGLIRRDVDLADRRRVLIELTAAGRRALEGGGVFRGTPIATAARRLNDAERKATVEALERLVTLAREEARD